MTFHSPREPLGSCCPDSAPSSRSQGSGGGWPRPVCSPVVRRQLSTPATSRVSEGGSVCRGAAVRCVQLWLVAVARLRRRHWLSRWGHLAQPVPLHMGRQECSSSGGWGRGWASLLTLGILTSRAGEAGRQDKPSRCARPRARHAGGESRTLLQRQFRSVHPQAVGTV